MQEIIIKLKNILPLKKYGIGDAKAFSDLESEINNGECEIIFDNDGTPTRCIKVVAVKIFYKGMALMETNQIFKDGRERKRNINGLSEKLLPNETPIDAARRAIFEELGIKDLGRKFNLVHYGSAVETKSSPSYPGLKTEYIIDGFCCEIPEEFYKPEGYITDEGSKTSFFNWHNYTIEVFSNINNA